MSQATAHVGHIEVGPAGRPEAVPATAWARRALIAAPSGVDTSVIRRALEARGVVPSRLDEAPIPGATILEILDDHLKRADLVVAVLDGSQAAANVLVEVGYAAALRKRILLLIPPDATPPFGASVCLRSGSTNEEAINFGIDQILRAPEPRDRPPHRIARGETKPLGPAADRWLGRIRTAGAMGEQELLEVVGGIFEASGISTQFRPPELHAGGARFDMGIWSGDFEPWIGNPLVIDVKQRLEDPAQLRRVAERITESLDAATAGWCLLICRHIDFRPDEAILQGSRVFVMTIEQLTESLRSLSLGDYLHQLRNSRVHGEG